MKHAKTKIPFEILKYFILILLLCSCSQKQKNKSHDLPAELEKRLQQVEKIEEIYSLTKKIQLSSPHVLFVGDIVYLYITKDKRIVTIDRANHVPLVFDSLGTFLTKIGRYGRGPGEFTGVSALCYDELNNIWYVSDNSQLKLSVFNDSYEYMKDFKIASGVKVLNLGQDGNLYLFMPNKRKEGMLECMNSEGKKITSFLTSKIVQKLRFGISGGGMCLTPDGIFATHYLSLYLNYFDYNGNFKTRYELKSLNGFIPPSDPSKVKDPAAYITSFTGVTRLLKGPFDMILVQYSRTAIQKSKPANKEKPPKYIAFIKEKKINNGIISSTAFFASDSDGNLYSVEYPEAKSIDEVENPIIIKWTLKSY